MSAKRQINWLAIIFIPFGLLVVGIPALFLFMNMTATSLHSDLEVIPITPGVVVSPGAEKGRQIVRAALVGQNLPGLSVAVGIRNQIVWSEGFGYADIDKRLPVTPAHRFRIGTASTVLTSAAAGLLLEQGALNLDERIQKYLPEFPEKKWPLTLRHLMSHTGGLTSDDGDEGILFSKHCEKPADALPHFSDSDLQFQPGTEFRFSRYGYILVSAAIEAASKLPFLTFIKEKVFIPLGMNDTLPDALKPAPNQVSFYFPKFAADPTYGPDPMRELDYSCYAGSSVFLSTPSDLVRFAMAVTTGNLLKSQTIKTLQSSQKAADKETGYGLGWDLKAVTVQSRSVPALGHDGDSLGGMVASIWTFPEQGITVAAISNISYADTSRLVENIAEVFAHDLSQGK